MSTQSVLTCELGNRRAPGGGARGGALEAADVKSAEVCDTNKLDSSEIQACVGEDTEEDWHQLPAFWNTAGGGEKESKTSLRSTARGPSWGCAPASFFSSGWYFERSWATFCCLGEGRVDDVRRRWLQHVEETRRCAKRVAREVTEPSACEC